MFLVASLIIPPEREYLQVHLFDSCDGPSGNAYALHVSTICRQSRDLGLIHTESDSSRHRINWRWIFNFTTFTKVHKITWLPVYVRCELELYLERHTEDLFQMHL